MVIKYLLALFDLLHLNFVSSHSNPCLFLTHLLPRHLATPHLSSPSILRSTSHTFERPWTWGKGRGWSRRADLTSSAAASVRFHTGHSSVGPSHIFLSITYTAGHGRP